MKFFKNVNAQGFKSLTLTNVEKSTLWREATYALPLLAGPEIAVASTKAYVAQAGLQAILAPQSLIVMRLAST